MVIKGIRIEKAARDKEWGFTEASSARFHRGSGTGILICHGFGGTPSNMLPLYERAVEMGFTVSMPLLDGHAKTLGEMAKTGHEAWRRNVDEAYSALVSSGCERIFLCGLSMGALLMADLAERRSSKGVDGVMLICPPVKMKPYIKFTEFIAPIAPYMLTADDFDRSPEGTEVYMGVASKKLKDISFLAREVKRGAARLASPVMLVEAGNDNRVDPDSYRILKKLIPQAEYTLIKGAAHGIPYCPKKHELCDIFEEYFSKLDR